MNELANDYKSTKLYLFNQKNKNPNLDGNMVFAMIRDSCREALNRLETDENEIVQENMKMLIANIPGLGENTVLELLASASVYLVKKKG